MKVSKYLKLKLPEKKDKYNVQDFNDNYEKIDAVCHTNQENFTKLARLTTSIMLCELTVNKWQRDGSVFKQEFVIDGIDSSCNPILIKNIPAATSIAEIKTYNKAFNSIFAGETATNKVIFYAYKKPERDFFVGLKGV